MNHDFFYVKHFLMFDDGGVGGEGVGGGQGSGSGEGSGEASGQEGNAAGVGGGQGPGSSFGGSAGGVSMGEGSKEAPVGSGQLSNEQLGTLADQGMSPTSVGLGGQQGGEASPFGDQLSIPSTPISAKVSGSEPVPSIPVGYDEFGKADDKSKGWSWSTNEGYKFSGQNISYGPGEGPNPMSIPQYNPALLQVPSLPQSQKASPSATPAAQKVIADMGKIMDQPWNADKPYGREEQVEAYLSKVAPTLSDADRQDILSVMWANGFGLQGGGQAGKSSQILGAVASGDKTIALSDGSEAPNAQILNAGQPLQVFTGPYITGVHESMGQRGMTAEAQAMSRPSWADWGSGIDVKEKLVKLYKDEYIDKNKVKADTPDMSMFAKNQWLTPSDWDVMTGYHALPTALVYTMAAEGKKINGIDPITLYKDYEYQRDFGEFAKLNQPDKKYYDLVYLKEGIQSTNLSDKAYKYAVERYGEELSKASRSSKEDSPVVDLISEALNGAAIGLPKYEWKDGKFQVAEGQIIKPIVVPQEPLRVIQVAPTLVTDIETGKVYDVTDIKHPKEVSPKTQILYIPKVDSKPVSTQDYWAKRTGLPDLTTIVANKKEEQQSGMVVGKGQLKPSTQQHQILSSKTLIGIAGEILKPSQSVGAAPPGSPYKIINEKVDNQDWQIITWTPDDPKIDPVLRKQLFAIAYDKNGKLVAYSSNYKYVESLGGMFWDKKDSTHTPINPKDPIECTSGNCGDKETELKSAHEFVVTNGGLQNISQKGVLPPPQVQTPSTLPEGVKPTINKTVPVKNDAPNIVTLEDVPIEGYVAKGKTGLITKYRLDTGKWSLDTFKDYVKNNKEATTILNLSGLIWCGPCNDERQDVLKLMDEYGGKLVNFIIYDVGYEHGGTKYYKTDQEIAATVSGIPVSKDFKGVRSNGMSFAYSTDEKGNKYYIPGGSVPVTVIIKGGEIVDIKDGYSKDGGITEIKSKIESTKPVSAGITPVPPKPEPENKPKPKEEPPKPLEEVKPQPVVPKTEMLPPVIAWVWDKKSTENGYEFYKVNDVIVLNRIKERSGEPENKFEVKLDSSGKYYLGRIIYDGKPTSDYNLIHLDEDGNTCVSGNCFKSTDPESIVLTKAQEMLKPTTQPVTEVPLPKPEQPPTQPSEKKPEVVTPKKPETVQQPIIKYKITELTQTPIDKWPKNDQGQIIGTPPPPPMVYTDDAKKLVTGTATQDIWRQFYIDYNVPYEVQDAIYKGDLFGGTPYLVDSDSYYGTSHYSDVTMTPAQARRAMWDLGTLNKIENTAGLFKLAAAKSITSPLKTALVLNTKTLSRGELVDTLAHEVSHYYDIKQNPLHRFNAEVGGYLYSVGLELNNRLIQQLVDMGIPQSQASVYADRSTSPPEIWARLNVINASPQQTGFDIKFLKEIIENKPIPESVRKTFIFNTKTTDEQIKEVNSRLEKQAETVNAPITALPIVKFPDKPPENIIDYIRGVAGVIISSTPLSVGISAIDRLVKLEEDITNKNISNNKAYEIAQEIYNDRVALSKKEQENAEAKQTQIRIKAQEAQERKISRTQDQIYNDNVKITDKGETISVLGAIIDGLKPNYLIKKGYDAKFVNEIYQFANNPNSNKYLTDGGIDVLKAIKAGVSTQVLKNIGISDSVILENKILSRLPDSEIVKELQRTGKIDNSLVYAGTDKNGEYILMNQFAFRQLNDNSKQKLQELGYEGWVKWREGELAKLEPYRLPDGSYNFRGMVIDESGIAAVKQLPQGIKPEDWIQKESYKKEEQQQAAKNIFGDDIFRKAETVWNLEHGQALLKETWESITPWDETKHETPTPSQIAVTAASLTLPFVQTATQWGTLSVGEKIAYLGTDALLTFVPMGFTGTRALSAMMRATGAVGAKQIARELGRVALAEITSPYYVLRHPLATAKVPWQLLKEFVDPNQMPEHYFARGVVNKTASELGHSDITLEVGKYGEPGGSTLASMWDSQSQRASGVWDGVNQGIQKIKWSKTGIEDVMRDGGQLVLVAHGDPALENKLEQLGSLGSFKVDQGKEKALFGTLWTVSEFRRMSATGKLGQIQGAIFIEAPITNIPKDVMKLRDPEKIHQEMLKRWERGELAGQVTPVNKQYAKFIEDELTLWSNKVGGADVKVVPVKTGKMSTFKYKEPEPNLYKKAEGYYKEAEQYAKDAQTLAKKMGADPSKDADIKALLDKSDEASQLYLKTLKESIDKGTNKVVKVDVDHVKSYDIITGKNQVFLHATLEPFQNVVKPWSYAGKLQGKLLGWRNVPRDIKVPAVDVPKLTPKEQLDMIRSKLKPDEQTRFDAGIKLHSEVNNIKLKPSEFESDLSKITSLPSNTIPVIDNWLNNTEHTIYGSVSSVAQNKTYRELMDKGSIKKPGDLDIHVKDPSAEMNTLADALNQAGVKAKAQSRKVSTGGTSYGVYVYDKGKWNQIVELSTEFHPKAVYQVFETPYGTRNIGGKNFTNLEYELSFQYNQLFAPGYGSYGTARITPEGKFGVESIGPRAAGFTRVKDIPKFEANNLELIRLLEQDGKIAEAKIAKENLGIMMGNKPNSINQLSNKLTKISKSTEKITPPTSGKYGAYSKYGNKYKQLEGEPSRIVGSRASSRLTGEMPSIRAEFAANKPLRVIAANLRKLSKEEGVGASRRVQTLEIDRIRPSLVRNVAIARTTYTGEGEQRTPTPTFTRPTYRDNRIPSGEQPRITPPIPRTPYSGETPRLSEPIRSTPDRVPPRFPPPRVPPRVPPEIPPRTPLQDKIKGLTQEQKDSAIAWKQGFMYKMIYKPWGVTDIINTREPIQGVKYGTGPKSAYESVVAKFGTNYPPVITRDMGIMKLRFTRQTGKDASMPEITYQERPDQAKHDERLSEEERKQLESKPVASPNAQETPQPVVKEEMPIEPTIIKETIPVNVDNTTIKANNIGNTVKRKVKAKAGWLF